MKDPSLLYPAAREYAHYPGGHNEGYPDGPKNLFRNVYGFIAGDAAGRRLLHVRRRPQRDRDLRRGAQELARAAVGGCGVLKQQEYLRCWSIVNR